MSRGGDPTVSNEPTGMAHLETQNMKSFLQVSEAEASSQRSYAEISSSRRDSVSPVILLLATPLPSKSEQELHIAGVKGYHDAGEIDVRSDFNA